MNLHIVPDNIFVNQFHENLENLCLLRNNRIIVRTNEEKLRFVRQDLPSAKLYSPAFRAICGKVDEYDKVFIHQFTPLLYRWVASNSFRELNWMTWGADLYNLPGTEVMLYEPVTQKKFISTDFSVGRLVYRLKVGLLHQRYQQCAYRKVTNILTWMKSEYEFATRHLPGLRGGYRFFFYENQLPYNALNDILKESPPPAGAVPTYILGNSASPELNHVDAVAWMQDENVRANLLVPISYGNNKYKAFLKENLSFFTGGEIRFIDRYMDIEEYLHFLYQADGLIMNNIRPQGYGNIFMMMYLGKKVFLNEGNLSIPDLDQRLLKWLPLKELKHQSAFNIEANRPAVLKLLSHETVLKVYEELFS